MYVFGEECGILCITYAVFEAYVGHTDKHDPT